MPTLEVNNLSCGYKSKEILHHITFNVEEGEFLGIIGPNGAVKSTLFRAISGILKPWQGKISFKGK